MAKEIKKMMRRHEGKEFVRVQQQGEGKPIISDVVSDHRVVAVGNTIHYSRNWKFFPDFLSDYLKSVMGIEWGNAEIKREWDERHPLMCWYHDYCLWQKKSEQRPDATYTAIATGVVYCYLGIAYGLYLLSHNVELQDRLVKRLKDPRNFQGAYYEIIVASCLIRAGFALNLEDEADATAKHCEFSATSKKTGKKYWVEAKMRSVRGMLGKTKLDGSPPTSKADAQVTKHLREALEKPALDERLIFIDVNAPGSFREYSSYQSLPSWVERCGKRLRAREREHKEGDRAYVFVTNLPFHWHLEEEAPPAIGLAYGLGIPDFAKEGKYRLPEIWKMKQDHIDVYNVMEAVKTYPQIPPTFDGELPLYPEDFGNRIQVGETYFFEDVGEKGTVAEVTSATVAEAQKKMFIGISATDGQNHIITREMSDGELEVYRAYRDGFFGVIHPQGKQTEDPYELFEWMMDAYKDTPREKLLELASGRPDLARLEVLDSVEIRLALCEAWTASVNQGSTRSGV